LWFVIKRIGCTCFFKKDSVKELALELDMVDHMIAALVNVLEKKGVLTSEEWEK
jgi:hypothetical protein